MTWEISNYSLRHNVHGKQALVRVAAHCCAHGATSTSIRSMVKARVWWCKWTRDPLQVTNPPRPCQWPVRVMIISEVTITLSTSLLCLVLFVQPLNYRVPLFSSIIIALVVIPTHLIPLLSYYPHTPTWLTWTRASVSLVLCANSSLV